MNVFYHPPAPDYETWLLPNGVVIMKLESQVMGSNQIDVFIITQNNYRNYAAPGKSYDSFKQTVKEKYKVPAVLKDLERLIVIIFEGYIERGF
jgi:hypothetical protein